MPVTAALAVRFAHPWALVALAVVAVPPLVAARARRRGRRVGTLPVALQCAAVALTACALAGPMAPLGASAEKPYLLLRDVSASVRGQALPDWPDALPVRRHVFAENVAPQGTPVDASATRIVPALRLATAQADQLAGAVIVTDANFHDADWSDAAAALGRTGLPVAVVPLAAPGADARVTGLAAQRPPHAGGGVRLRATVTASASQTRRVSLRRVAPDERIFPPRRVELAAGASATVTLDDRTAPTDATAVYEARLLGKDAFGENDSARAVATPRRQRVAWVSSQGPPPGFADALGTAEVTVLAPDEATSTVDGWSPYAAVVLVDATGLILDAPRRAALGAYVRSAGGLVLVGTGPHRSPADRDDPLNAVAALTARPYERTPLKVVVVLDASGSMGEPAGGGRSRFDVAVEAVMAMEPHLMPHDALAVVTFSARARTVYDSGLSRPDFARLHDALRGARAGGPTHVLPALQRAAGLGATRDARSGEPDGDRRTLVILVSDLLDRRFDPDAAARLFGEHRHLAVVVAAAADDPRQAPLRELARRADAPLQAAADLGDLDELFVEFLRRLRGEALRRGRFRLRPAPGADLAAAADAMSPLPAYIVSRAQPDADVLVRVAATGAPVLARRRVGLGASVAFATALRELPGRLDEPLAALLAAQTRTVLRPPGRPGFTARAERRNGDLRVSVRAVQPDRLPDEWPRDGLELVAAATAPDEPTQPREARMRQVGPGRYAADLPVGTGPVAVTVRTAGSADVAWRGSVASAGPAEFRAIGANREALRRLAGRTGGRITAGAELAELARRWRRRGLLPLGAPLVLAALAVMLVEWALGRVRRRSTPLTPASR